MVTRGACLEKVLAEEEEPLQEGSNE